MREGPTCIWQKEKFGAPLLDLHPRGWAELEYRKHGLVGIAEIRNKKWRKKAGGVRDHRHIVLETKNGWRHAGTFETARADERSVTRVAVKPRKRKEDGSIMIEPVDVGTSGSVGMWLIQVLFLFSFGIPQNQAGVS